MITSLRLVDFKNFRDATLGVGSFTVIVGANASGKSNIRDAFRFLHGIGRGYTLAEIAGGRYGPGGQQEWEPIRGATTEIAGCGQPGVILGVELSKDVRYSIQATLDPPGSDRTGEFRVNKEELVERDRSPCFGSTAGRATRASFGWPVRTCASACGETSRR